MQKVLIIITSLLSFTCTKAQTIKGRVINKDKQGIEGVTITNKSGSVHGTTTGNGNFTITIPGYPDTLLLSHIAYQTLSVPVKENNQQMVFRMQHYETSMDEVTIVSTGYQKVPRERSTGSFDMLNNKAVNRRVSPDIMSRLQGMASGIIFNKVNDKQEITLRSLSTIEGDKQPLIVVDNFPYEGNLTNINPNDVADISILKDASAASVWGARAANGVIVITTKAARTNEKPRVQLNTNITMADKLDLFYIPKMQSTDIINVEKMLFGAGKYDIDLQYYPYKGQSPVINALAKLRNGEISQAEATAQIDALRAFDNRDGLNRHANERPFSQQYAINYSGGTNTSGYYLGIGYDRGMGRLKDPSERITLNLRNNFKIAERLSLMTGVVLTQNIARSGVLPHAASRFPYERLVDENGNALAATDKFNQHFVNQASEKGLLDWSYNPMEDAKLNNAKNKTREYRIQAALSYQVLEGLSASVNYQFQKQDIENTDIKNKNSYAVRDMVNRFTQFDSNGDILWLPVPKGGIVNNSRSENIAHNGRFQLSYQNRFGEHSVNAIGGAELRQVSAFRNGYTLYGFDEITSFGAAVNAVDYFLTYPDNNYNTITGGVAHSAGNLDRFRSAFFNAGYSFREKYHFSASARKDASNYFGVKTNQRALPLWSVGGKWDISREAFFSRSWISNLQFRTTYGYGGTIIKSQTAVTTIQYMGPNQFQLPHAMIASPPNPSLRWEKTGILNTGIDFVVFNDRVSGSVEYYWKTSADLFGIADIDGTLGLTDGSGISTFKGNIASMKGHGIDLRLNVKWFDKSFRWNTNILFSTVSDEITKYDFKPTVNNMLNSYVSPLATKPVYSVYSYAWAGLDPQTGMPRGFLEKEPSTDYVKLVNPTTEDLLFHGAGTPRNFGSINNEFVWRNLSLSVLVTWKGNYYFRRNSIDYGALFGNLASHSDYEKRWQKPGDEELTDVPVMNYPGDFNATTFYKYSSVLVERGDHIRLQDIRMSYNASLFKRKPGNVIPAQFYLYISNIGVIFKRTKEAIDPDYITTIPSPLSVSVGMTASF